MTDESATPDEPDDPAVDVGTFFDALERHERPVVTASEVARLVDCSQSAAVDALESLVETGDLQRLDVESDPVGEFEPPDAVVLPEFHLPVDVSRSRDSRLQHPNRLAPERDAEPRGGESRTVPHLDRRSVHALDVLVVERDRRVVAVFGDD